MLFRSCAGVVGGVRGSGGMYGERGRTRGAELVSSCTREWSAARVAAVACVRALRHGRAGEERWRRLGIEPCAGVVGSVRGGGGMLGERGRTRGFAWVSRRTLMSSAARVAAAAYVLALRHGGTGVSSAAAVLFQASGFFGPLFQLGNGCRRLTVFLPVWWVDYGAAAAGRPRG